MEIGIGSMIVIVLLVLLFTLGSIAYMVYWCAKADIGLFTYLEPGEIKIIMSGSNPVAVLANLPNDHVENMEVVPGTPHKKWLEENWGLYRLPILPPGHVHEFEFTHERVNPKIGKKTSPDEWMVRDEKPKKTKVLRFSIPHSYFIPDVEFADGFQGDVMLDLRSLATRPITAVFICKGQFIDYMAQYVNAAVIDVLKGIKLKDFLTAAKTEASPIAVEIINRINTSSPLSTTGPTQILEDAVGLKVVGGYISRFAPSQEALDAIEAEVKANLGGDADIAASAKAIKVAENKKLQTIVEAEAERDADTIRAEAQVSGLKWASEIINREHPNAPADLKLKMATELAVSIKLSNPGSNIVVWGGANSNVNITPKDKNQNNQQKGKGGRRK